MKGAFIRALQRNDLHSIGNLTLRGTESNQETILCDASPQ